MTDETSYMLTKWACSSCGRLNSVLYDEVCPRCVANAEGGLSSAGIKALGFDVMCRCGHEDGLHDPYGHCAAIPCPCQKFERAQASGERHD